MICDPLSSYLYARCRSRYEQDCFEILYPLDIKMLCTVWAAILDVNEGELWPRYNEFWFLNQLYVWPLYLMTCNGWVVIRKSVGLHLFVCDFHYLSFRHRGEGGGGLILDYFLYYLKNYIVLLCFLCLLLFLCLRCSIFAYPIFRFTVITLVPSNFLSKYYECDAVIH